MECMQLQEDRCRPGHMQLKLESNLIGGVRFHFPILHLNSLASIVDLCIFQTPLKQVTREVDMCFPMKNNIFSLVRAVLFLIKLWFLPFPVLY
jgi:hypothetical protein